MEFGGVDLEVDLWPEAGHAVLRLVLEVGDVAAVQLGLDVGLQGEPLGQLDLVAGPHETGGGVFIVLLREELGHVRELVVREEDGLLVEGPHVLQGEVLVRAHGAVVAALIGLHDRREGGGVLALLREGVDDRGHVRIVRVLLHDLISFLKKNIKYYSLPSNI